MNWMQNCEQFFRIGPRAMTDSQFTELLSKCRIWNGWTGLEQLHAQSLKEPSQAHRILFPFLMSKGDPGKDDGQLCSALLEVLTEAVGHRVVEDVILAEWSRLSDPIRWNFIWSVYNHKNISLDFAVKLFDHPDSRTQQRHLIVAALAAGEERPGRQERVRDLAKRIGSYSDPDRQASLDVFLAMLA